MPDEKVISEKDHEETITVPEHKRKKKRTFEEAMADLPVEKVIHDLEDKTCDKCGAEMIEIGKEERDELVYTPAKFHIRRHIIKVYKCTKCGSAPENDAELEDIEACHIVKAYCPTNCLPISFMRNTEKLFLCIVRRRISHRKRYHCLRQQCPTGC